MRRTSSRHSARHSARRVKTRPAPSTAIGPAAVTVEPRLAAFGLGTVRALDTGLSGPFIGELRHGATVEPGAPASYGLDLEAVLARGHQRSEPGRGPAVPAAQYAPQIAVLVRAEAGGPRDDDPSTVLEVEPSEASRAERAPAQLRLSRISTRGNPPETESVSAAFVKPARSNSERVPT